MKKSFTVFFIALIFFSFSNSLKAQDDCCGMGSIFQSMVQSGIFGGYGIQQFSAEGLNNLVHDNHGLDQNFSDFGTGYGWRVGANILGFRSKDLMTTLKFYYQSMRERQEAAGTFEGEKATQQLTVDINSWNFGMSFSYILGPNFDLRIFDAYISWTNVKFTNEINSSNAPPKDKYNTPDTQIGFTGDAGIVWYPLPPYLSIEILGGYSLFSAENLELENGGTLTTNGDFVDNGGFFAVAVLTVGIPFN